MATATKKTTINAGDTIHALVTGVTVPAGDIYAPSHVTNRGDNIAITDALIEASRDRNGDSWLDAIAEGNDPRFGLGRFPESEPLLLPGTREYEAERQRRRNEAWLIPTTAERELALAEVRKEFGNPPASGTSVSYDARN